jgi:hypothetical protein
MLAYSEIGAVEAEAVFGSAARGDSDALSDRDILIVDDDIVLLKSRAKALSSEGWSVASYTFAKLEALARQKALFIQHLKLESTIRVDHSGRLTSILGDFTPKADYGEEILQNGVLAALAGVVPRGGKGALLSADILYVTVRNFGVLSLAERGIHAFGFHTVTEALEAEGLIEPGGARALSALRFLKCLYRSGETTSGKSARDVIDTALAVLPHHFFPSVLKLVAPEDIVLLPEPEVFAPAYFQLRDLERRFVALELVCGRDFVYPEMNDLSRWIANPRAYAALSGRLAPKLRALMVRQIDAMHERVGVG